MQESPRILSTKKLLPNQKQFLLNANFAVIEADFIEIKGWKATGNKITYDTFKSAKLLSEKVGTWEEEVKEEVISESIVPEIVADELDGQKTLF